MEAHIHGDRCNPSLPLLPPVCHPPTQPLIATDPPSRLRTHAALQSAVMPVDFRRFWCHNEGGCCFETAPREFHAPCVSNELRRSAGRYSRNWSFIAFAQGGLPAAPGAAGMGRPRRRRQQTLLLPWTPELHFSRHLKWKHGTNPANLFQIQRDTGWYTTYSSSSLLTQLIDSGCWGVMTCFWTEKLPCCHVFPLKTRTLVFLPAKILISGYKMHPSVVEDWPQ